MSEYIVDFGTSTYKSSDGLVYAPVKQLREEIVRCRDCVYSINDRECSRPDEVYDEHWFAIEPDGFCAWGERRSK